MKPRILLKILYLKWIKGVCRNLCCLCDYRNQCFDELEDL